jgi:predicted ribosomally synthesized peptide with nif11-like leader
MSRSEVERFSKDLKSKPDLLAKVKPHATGLASVVSLAAQNGYHFSLEDAKQFIKANSPQPLNDKQLDAIAGAGSTNVNTNVEVNAEAAVNAVAVQSGAAVTDVAVAAVVVLI